MLLIQLTYKFRFEDSDFSSALFEKDPVKSETRLYIEGCSFIFMIDQNLQC